MLYESPRELKFWTEASFNAILEAQMVYKQIYNFTMHSHDICSSML